MRSVLPALRIFPFGASRSHSSRSITCQFRLSSSQTTSNQRSTFDIRSHDELQSQMPTDLKIYQELLERQQDHDTLNDNLLENVHVNPASHWLTCNSHNDRTDVPLSEQKSLTVSIIGLPNSGKSTLANCLTGFSGCAYSSKHHTTRKNAQVILLQEKTQIILKDTPGVVNSEDAKKFKLEDSLVLGPVKSLKKADLIVYVHDVSNRFVRESIDKRVLEILCHHINVPSVLVLNKIDKIPKSRNVYELIRKLTCNHLDGMESDPDRTSKRKYMQKIDPDRYVKERLRGNPSSAIKDPIKNSDFLKLLQEESGTMTDERVKELLKGVIGWPKFKDVFVTSCMDDKGIDDLRNYLLQLAVERPWSYSEKLRSLVDPRELVISIVKSKFLEWIPGDIAYGLKPMIGSWLIEQGVLMIRIDVESFSSRTTFNLLGKKGDKIKVLAKGAENDLQNFFQCDVNLHINVITNHKKKCYTEDLVVENLDVFL